MNDKCPKCGANFLEIGSRGERWFRCYTWEHPDMQGEVAQSERCLRAQLALATAELDSLRVVVARVEAIRRRIITDGAVYLASEIGEILAYQPKVLATVRGWANKDDVAASFNPDRDQLGPNAVPVTALFVERESND